MENPWSWLDHTGVEWNGVQSPHYTIPLLLVDTGSTTHRQIEQILARQDNRKLNESMIEVFCLLNHQRLSL